MVNKGTISYSTLRPATSADTFPIIYTNEALGGLQSYNSITERDNIYSSRRIIGMEVNLSGGTKYILSGGTLNGNWVQIPTSIRNIGSGLTIYNGIDSSGFAQFKSFIGNGVTITNNGNEIQFSVIGGTGSANLSNDPYDYTSWSIDTTSGATRQAIANKFLSVDNNFNNFLALSAFTAGFGIDYTNPTISVKLTDFANSNAVVGNYIPVRISGSTQLAIDSNDIISSNFRNVNIVDPNGNNSIAITGDVKHTYSTIASAYSNTLDGDLIILMAGTYTETSLFPTVGKTIYLYCMPGVTLKDCSILANNANNRNIVIRGHAKITNSVTRNFFGDIFGSAQIIGITLDIECDSIENTSTEGAIICTRDIDNNTFKIKTNYIDGIYFNGTGFATPVTTASTLTIEAKSGYFGFFLNGSSSTIIPSPNINIINSKLENHRTNTSLSGNFIESNGNPYCSVFIKDSYIHATGFVIGAENGFGFFNNIYIDNSTLLSDSTYSIDNTAGSTGSTLDIYGVLHSDKPISANVTINQGEFNGGTIKYDKIISTPLKLVSTDSNGNLVTIYDISSVTGGTGSANLSNDPYSFSIWSTDTVSGTTRQPLANQFNSIDIQLTSLSARTTTQNIVLSGDVTGSGSTAITTTVVWSNGYPTYDLRYLKISDFNIYSGATNNIFTGYTATTNTLIGTKLNTTDFNSWSGNTLQNNLNLKLNVTDFNTYSAATLTNINTRLLISDFNTYSATTNTLIGTKLNVTDFTSWSANTLTNNLVLKLNVTDFNSWSGGTFNTYTAATQSQLNTKLSSNQQIILSGDVTGSGSTAITTTVVWTNGYSTYDLRYLPINNPAYTGILSTGTLTYSDTNILASLQSSVNSYNQLIIQNSNSGVTASADFVVSNNLSTATSFFGDFGMNSSTFTGTTNSFNLPNAIYLSATSGDLVIGTTTQNAIRFLTNSNSDSLLISSAGTSTFFGNIQGPSFSGTSFTGNTYFVNDGTTPKLALNSNASNSLQFGSGFTTYLFPGTTSIVNLNHLQILDTDNVTYRLALDTVSAQNIRLGSGFTGATLYGASTGNTVYLPNITQLVDGNGTSRTVLSSAANNGFTLGADFINMTILPTTITWAGTVGITNTTGQVSFTFGNSTLGLRTNKNTTMNQTTTAYWFTMDGGPITSSSSAVIDGARFIGSVTNITGAITVNCFNANPTINALASSGNVYGFRSQINTLATTSGTTWNIYADGTAPSYFAGGARINPRVVAMADATSFTPNADKSDIVTQANTQGIGTLTANSPSGTPVNGQNLLIQIKSTNVQTFAWNAIYVGCTTTVIPTATTGGGKTDKFFFQYNTDVSKWQIIMAEYGYT